MVFQPRIFRRYFMVVAAGAIALSASEPLLAHRGNERDTRRDRVQTQNRQKNDSAKAVKKIQHIKRRAVHRAPLTDVQRKERLEILKMLEPKMYARLKQFEKKPQMMRAAIDRVIDSNKVGHQIQRLAAMREEDSQGFELQIANIQLTRECTEQGRKLRARKTSAASRAGEQQRQKLRELVGEHFDIRQKMRERELAKLENRIRELRRTLDQRNGSRTALIEKRFLQLTSEPNTAAW